MIGMASLGLVLWLLALSAVAKCEAQDPPVWAQLYSGPDQTGDRLLTEDYMGDLLLQNFDDKTSSYCVSGVWLFYEHRDYDGTGIGAVTSVVGGGRCENVSPELAEKISSARQAGSPSTPSRPTLTLYGRTHFRGKELYLTRNLSDFGPFEDEAYSAIVTGDIPWTVYTYDAFQGSGTCLAPQQWVTLGGEPVGVGLFPTYHELGSSGAIRSARQGCETREGVDQVMGQGVDQVMGQGVDQVMDQGVDQVMGQGVDQVMGQGVDQVMGQGVDQVMGQGVDQETGQSEAGKRENQKED
ncbi:uncharacterized protein LOC122254122 isoform X3 [Penaeus japonicus]|uniref:uncharacterized protein LOC122254122 isoform X3 n=1 Tax=Penaeus japonicus TaxID=27405 RepID=UPI001C711C78|nr:uncharacterized protein LOC122254122 isoform X3 [Penaeus japonicus]